MKGNRKFTKELQDYTNASTFERYVTHNAYDHFNNCFKTKTMGENIGRFIEVMVSKKLLTLEEAMYIVSGNVDEHSKYEQRKKS